MKRAKTANAAKPMDMNLALQMLAENHIDPDFILKKFNILKLEKEEWTGMWQMIQDQTFPNYRDYKTPGGISSPGASRDSLLVGSSVISGKINKCVALLSSQIVDPATKWLRLTYVGQNINAEKINNWINSCTNKLYELFSDPASNFYPSTYSFLLDWFSLGTACRQIVLRNDTGKIRFNTISMQNIAVELSGHEEIQSVFRSFFLTARQAFELWGENIHSAEAIRAQRIADLDEALATREIFPPETPNMTATEINERKIQASNRMRPLLVMLETEDLGPTIIRTLTLMENMGMLDPFPYKESGVDPLEVPYPIQQLRVTFSGQLSKMQKMQDIVNNEFVFQKVVQGAQIDPNVLDRIDLDKIIKVIAEHYDIDPDVMRPEEDVVALRKARAEQQQRAAYEQDRAIAINSAVKLKEAGLDGV